MTPSPDIARILICEDSRAYAEALAWYLERDSDLEVVGRVASAEALPDAVRRLRPDLITVDLELPGAHGIDAVREVMATEPTPILVLSAHAERGSETAAEALGAGALEAQSKDELRLKDADTAWARAFRRRVKRLARARVPGAPRGRLRPAATRVRPRAGISVVALAASTGGPPALEAVLSALPARYPIPVLVVQHMSPGFIDGLVGWLDGRLRLGVRLARADAPIEPGVWVAPDGAHLVVDDRMRTQLDRRTAGGHHRPGADLLLRSLADSAGPHCATVVLTGMGRDGAQGTAAVRAAGGLTIAQDEATSAIYGMPRAAAEQGAELVLPLEQIGTLLADLAAVPSVR